MTSAGDFSVLIAGVGSIGQRHLRNLDALGVANVALFRTGRAVREVPEAVGRPVFGKLSAALAARPSAVVISNPTALHMEVALSAARNGAHLFIEKPLSHSLVGVADLEREVAARGLTAMVGFQFRFHPTLQRVKQWVEAGRIGRIISAHAHWGEYLPEWHPGEDYRESYAAREDLGGGVVLTLSHPIDYLRWLFGDPLSAQAILRRGSVPGVLSEDAALVGLRFAAGAIASVYVDYAQRPPRHDLAIVGERGTIFWDSRDHSAVVTEGATLQVERAVPPEGFDRNVMFFDEMRHFLECVRSGSAPAVSLADGVAALQIALVAKQSHSERREIAIDAARLIPAVARGRA